MAKKMQSSVRKRLIRAYSDIPGWTVMSVTPGFDPNLYSKHRVGKHRAISFGKCAIDDVTDAAWFVENDMDTMDLFHGKKIYRNLVPVADKLLSGTPELSTYEINFQADKIVVV